MHRRDVSELDILQAVRATRQSKSVYIPNQAPYISLAHKYPVKLIMARMHQLNDQGLLDYGVSLRTAWLTKIGEQRLSELEDKQ